MNKGIDFVKVFTYCVKEIGYFAVLFFIVWLNTQDAVISLFILAF